MKCELMLKSMDIESKILVCPHLHSLNDDRVSNKYYIKDIITQYQRRRTL